MIDVDDDPIVAEYDVYLTHHVGKTIYCLEHDSRPSDRPYELNDATVRVKPKIPKVEMKVPLHECDEYISDKDFNLVLTSKKPVSKTQNNALGLFINNEFHLFSAPEILQMYPVIDNKKNAADDDVGDVREFSIVAKFKQRATEAEKNRELASYQYMKSQEDQDPWVDVVCKNIDSHIIKSLTKHSSNGSSEFDMTPKEYFEACIPRLEDKDDEKVEVKQTSNDRTNSGSQNNNANATLNEEKLIALAKEKFNSRIVMSLQEFQAQVNINFYSTNSKQELEDAMVKAGGVVLSASKTNPVYALKCKGSKDDAIRECLINMFIAKPTLKMAVVKTELDKRGIHYKNDNELKVILKEYSTSRGGTWLSKAQTYKEDSKSSKKS